MWKNKKRLLESIIIELTERCNNNCIHCYINKPEDDPVSLKRELSSSEIFHILNEAASLGCMNVRFTGGEPLLRSDFEQIYLHARKLGMLVEIFTNATPLTPQLVELFARIPPRRKIVVSVYGISKNVYEKVTRVSGSHEAAFRGLNQLLKKNIPTIINTPILSQNKHEMEVMESWVSTHLKSNHPSTSVMFLSMHARRDKVKSDLIKMNRIPPQEGLNILIKNKEEYIRGAQQFFSRNSWESNSNLFTCGAGIGGGCVDAYGILQMCTMLRHPKTGYNLKQGSLKDAINKFFPSIREMQASGRQYLSRCANCFLKNYCDNCPAQSWSAHGTLNGIDEYFCEIAHTEARFLGLLSNSENAWKVKDWKERLIRFTENPSLFEIKRSPRQNYQEIQNGKKCKT